MPSFIKMGRDNWWEWNLMIYGHIVTGIKTNGRPISNVLE